MNLFPTKGLYSCLILCQVFISRGLSMDEQPTPETSAKKSSDSMKENGRDRRIVGGRNIEEGEIPYLAFVGYWVLDKQRLAHHCGGSIIDQYYVLTAAHCLHNMPAPLRVLAGHMELPQDGDLAWNDAVDVLAYIVHPHYNHEQKENDVAILMLATPLPVNGLTISTIALNTDSEACPDPQRHQKCLVSGWGQLYYDGPVTNKAKAVNVTAVSNQECAVHFASVDITPDQLCAGEMDVGGKDACLGDSGGPLACTCEGRTVLAGVVSYGTKCALPDLPGVYSRVSYNADWIKDVLNEPSKHNWTPN